MSAILMILGVWILFANVYGDTAKLTGSQVAKRCALGAALTIAGLAVVAWDVYKLLY